MAKSTDPAAKVREIRRKMKSAVAVTMRMVATTIQRLIGRIILDSRRQRAWPDHTRRGEEGFRDRCRGGAGYFVSPPVP